MQAVLCTSLFPEGAQRTLASGTIAVRELVEQARECGLEIDQVIKFSPFVNRHGVTRPRRVRVGDITVFEVPRIGVGHMYSAAATRRLLRWLGADLGPRVLVVHMSRHVESARRILAGPDSRLVFVVHSNDLHHYSLTRSLDGADRVLCRSNSVAEQLRRLTGRECDGIVYSGIPEREFCDFAAKRWDTDTLRVVMASKFAATKNIVPSLEAIALVARRHRVRVELFGDGEIRASVDAAIERLGLGDIVMRHGFAPRTRVLEAMFRADLFLMPSTIETLGLAYLEAMANGCVVVGLRGWGIDGIVTDGVDGFLAESSAPEDIAERIEAYLAADRPRLHERAYALARQYTSGRAARNYAEHVGRVLA